MSPFRSRLLPRALLRRRDTHDPPESDLFPVRRSDDDADADLQDVGRELPEQTEPLLVQS